MADGFVVPPVIHVDPKLNTILTRRAHRHREHSRTASFFQNLWRNVYPGAGSGVMHHWEEEFTGRRNTIDGASCVPLLQSIQYNLARCEQIKSICFSQVMCIVVPIIMYNGPVRVDLHVIQFVEYEAEEAGTVGDIGFEFGGGHPSNLRAFKVGKVLDAEYIERIHGLRQFGFVAPK